MDFALLKLSYSIVITDNLLRHNCYSLSIITEGFIDSITISRFNVTTFQLHENENNCLVRDAEATPEHRGYHLMKSH
jgi:hypothetical protein